MFLIARRFESLSTPNHESSYHKSKHHLSGVLCTISFLGREPLQRNSFFYYYSCILPVVILQD